MSASSKKKLRKEQSAAELTERQQQEHKESKKLKRTTTFFVVVMLVIALIAVSVLAVRGINNSGIYEKKTTAVVIGDHELNSVVANYYFVDYATNYYAEAKSVYGDFTNYYLTMSGLDPTIPLDMQSNPSTEVLWSEEFTAAAMEKAKEDYAVYIEAMAEGYTLSEINQYVLDYNLEAMQEQAKYVYGYKNINKFLRAYYGPGSDLESYTEYITISAIAAAYNNDKSASFEYTEDDIRTYNETYPNDFFSYDFAYYYVNYTNYLEGGTPNENNVLTYSDEECDAAREEAKKVADSLMECKDLEALDAAIAALEENKNVEDAGTTVYEDTFYTQLPEALQEWLSDDSRKENEMAVLPHNVTSTDDEGNETTATNGYYVVVYHGRNDNQRPLANVRHLLVEFTGGTTNKDGTITYSDEEKAAAKEKAEEYYQLWKSGENPNEETFIELVKEYSADNSASLGGLIEDICASSNYVTNFLEWSIDPEREVGDTDIIETEYGYHIMFYSSDDEMTYHDYMIQETLRATDLSMWFNTLINKTTLETVDLSRIRTKLIMSA